jgi:DNA processing protein
MEREELAAWLRLTLTPGVGNETARKLLAAFGLPGSIFSQSTSALTQVASPAQAANLLTEPPELAALLTTTWQWLLATQTDDGPGEATEGVVQRRIVALGDAGYPATLLNMADPPLMLYLLGVGLFEENNAAALVNRPQAAPDLIATSLTRSIAMVGSRNPTPQGLTNAHDFARAFSEAGVTVVSGLALGVDGAAHEGALAGRKPPGDHQHTPLSTRPARLATIAVVGTGLDRVYPQRHRKLAHAIARHGLIISEYPLGTPPLPPNFPKRNRLIAGLTQGTLVVEAALQSGSLITARLAADQGKEVFAIPGSIHSPMSRGCHALIRQGAKLVESAQDVLEDLAPSVATKSIAPRASSTRAKGAIDLVDAMTDSDEESGLLQALGFDPVSLDALQARTGMDTPSLQAQLMTLELDGQVARLPGGLFQRTATA